MKRLRLGKDKILEENIIKYKRNLFRLKKEIYSTTVKDERNLFRFRNKKIKQLKIEQLETF